MKLVIFGIGISGRAIYRQAKENWDIVAFVDNNKELDGTTYDGVKIFSVNKIKDLDFDKVAIGGVWVDSMEKQLLDLGLLRDKIMVVEDDVLNNTTQNRIETTDNIVREFARLMRENEISYCIEGSSLLCLLRGDDLSKVPDVDVLIKSQNDLQRVWEVLNQSRILKEHHLIKNIYKEDKVLTKKKTIDKIIIRSKADPSLDEPTVIDINLAVDIGRYYIMDYVDGYYLYFNKEFVDGINFFRYKDFEVLIPSQPEKYVELLYGKSWRIPAKKWSYKDYGNLLDTNELIEMLKQKGA